MIQVNAVGDACPIPVVKTLQALKSLTGAGSVETLVDNRIAVENLTRLAQSKTASGWSSLPRREHSCRSPPTDCAPSPRKSPKTPWW